MASIDFPAYLNEPQQNGFTRQRAEGFSTSNPASGSAFYVIETEDLPVIYNVTFRFSPDKSMAFAAWIRLYKEVLFGAQFNISIYGEGEDKIQEARFTQGGTPQLTGVSGLTNTYTAQIEVRKLIEDGEGDEELILGTMELGGSSKLDETMNIEYPEA